MNEDTYQKAWHHVTFEERCADCGNPVESKELIVSAPASLEECKLTDEEIAHIWTGATNSINIDNCLLAQLFSPKLIALILRREEAARKEVVQIALQSIADEPEFPGDMPDELWDKLNGNKDTTNRAMRNTVRLTKNGITERFLQALKPGVKP